MIPFLKLWNWRHRSKSGKPKFDWIKAPVNLEMKGWIISFLVADSFLWKSPSFTVLAITCSILKNYTFNFPLEILATVKRGIYSPEVRWRPWCLCRVMQLVSHRETTVNLASVGGESEKAAPSLSLTSHWIWRGKSAVILKHMASPG